MWEEETDDNSRTSRAKDVAQLEILAVRRSVFLALVFNHLCYFHPKMVTLEDSPQGLSLRLGLSLDLLAAIKDQLAQPPLAGLQTGSEFAAAQVQDGSCKVFQGSQVGAITVVQVAVAETRVSFVCMMGNWTMWANCIKDNAQVLTECSNVQKYFAFDTASSNSAPSAKD